MISRTVSTLVLVVCLLLSVSVAPVLAQDQNNYVEDGVKLIKVGNYPAKLDRVFYGIVPEATVAIDGNQYYWVQIGKDKAKQLTSNDLAKWICENTFGLSGIAVAAGVGFVMASSEAGSSGTATPAVIYVMSFVAGGTVQMWASGAASVVCPIVEKQLVSEKYRYTDADGCILLRVGKLNEVAAKQDLKTIGIDIERLTHLSKEENIGNAKCLQGQTRICNPATSICSCK